MIRKDVVIAVLATFCLTSTLFMITTSKSQSGVGEYNPWADYNGDGVIDIFDIVPGAVSFGAEGDPTKSVNVTNLPLDEYGNLRVSTGATGTPKWRNATFIFEMFDFNPSETYLPHIGRSFFDGGIWLLSETQFSFYPLDEPFNVTDIWITGVFGTHDEAYGVSFSSIIINGLLLSQGASAPNGGPTYFGIHITDSLVRQSIHLGTNSLSFEGQNVWTRFWKVTAQITYTYYG